ncbi:MAG: DUF4129 domain-containing protein [Longimicrobiaceae bacterium]
MADQLPTAAEIQRAVTTVYSRPEYAERHGIREWFAGKLREIYHWIADQLGSFGELRLTNPWIFWLVVGWLAIAAALLLGHLVWTALQAARRAEPEVEPATGKAVKTKPRTAADWEAEAARLAAEGKLREAAAALYQALLLRLDGRGAVRFDPSKTPGDYRREARPHPEAARALTAFLRLFEPVAFGGRGLDREGWERMRLAAAEGGAGA